jgi:hypothetical protein
VSEIHAVLIESLEEQAPRYATVKNWVAEFKRGDFSTFFLLIGLRTYQHPDIFEMNFCSEVDIQI